MSDDPDLPDIAVAVDAPVGPPERRRPGRKPILNPDGTRKHPPRSSSRARKGDRAPRRAQTTTPRAPSRASLKSRVAAQLTMLSMIVSVVPPISKDALSPQEIELLADGIDRQCSMSPRFRKYVELALNASAAGGILGAVAIVGARRVSRHELLGVPTFIDPVLGAMIGENGETPKPDDPKDASEVQNLGVGFNEVEPLVPMGAPGPIVENGAAHVYDFEHGDFTELVKS